MNFFEGLSSEIFERPGGLFAAIFFAGSPTKKDFPVRTGSSGRALLSPSERFIRAGLAPQSEGLSLSRTIIDLLSGNSVCFGKRLHFKFLHVVVVCKRNQHLVVVTKRVTTAWHLQSMFLSATNP